MAMAQRMKTGVLILVASVALTACATQPHKELSEVMVLQQHAQAAYAQGNLEQAQKNYLQLTRILPNDEDTWFHLGNVYARIGQPELAVNAYRHVLQHNASHAKAWHNLGIVLMQQAEAALAQSARHARGNKALRDASLAMAHQLDKLVQPAAPPAAPVADGQEE
jgi:Tfp pilus assembly protein PilF